MRRTIAVALSLAVTVLLGAGSCDVSKPSTEHSASAQAPAKPAVPPVVQQPTPPPGAQQPAPCPDPGCANKQPGELDLHVEWVSENRKTPSCEWSLNSPGLGHPCENLQEAHQVDRYYYGLWEYETTAKAGDIGWLSAQANIGGETIRCSYFWKGALHDLPSSGKRCGGQFTLN